MLKVWKIALALLVLASLQALGWLWIVVGLMAAFAPFAFIVEQIIIGDDDRRRPLLPEWPRSRAGHPGR